MQVHSRCGRSLQCQGLKIGMRAARGRFRSRSIFVISLSLFLTVSAWSQTASGPIVFTVAGGGLPAGVPATSTGIGSGDGMAVDSNGNLYIADSANYVIRKVDPNGILTTVAGNGVSGLTIDLFGNGLGNPGKIGDGGSATNAEFSFPSNIAVDNNGNLYIDDFEALIRKVDANGVITTV